MLGRNHFCILPSVSGCDLTLADDRISRDLDIGAETDPCLSVR